MNPVNNGADGALEGPHELARPVLPELDRLAGEVGELLDRMGVVADRIDTRFARAAARHAGLVATADPDAEATYLELEWLADEVTRRLAGRAGPGRAVGLRLAPGRLAPAAVLGVLRAGAVCLPLPDNGPDGLQERLLDGAGVELVLSDRGLLGDESPQAKAGPFVLATRSAPARSEAWADDAAFLSGDGTTVVRHAELLARLDTMVPRLGTGPEDVWAVPPALLRDVWVPWAALLSGGRLTLTDAVNAGDLGRAMAERRATVLVWPATTFDTIASGAGYRLPALRRLVLIGPETVPDTALHRWRDAVAPYAEVLTEHQLSL